MGVSFFLFLSLKGENGNSTKIQNILNEQDQSKSQIFLFGRSKEVYEVIICFGIALKL